MKINPIAYALPAIWTCCILLSQVGDMQPAHEAYKKTFDVPLLLAFILFTTAAAAYHAGRGDFE